jgi:hypothetical protein
MVRLEAVLMVQVVQVVQTQAVVAVVAVVQQHRAVMAALEW